MLGLVFALALSVPDPSVLTVHVEVVLQTPQELAVQIAHEYGLNTEHFLATIKCESGWNTRAEGDGGTSFGLAQLHNPVTDWGITAEEAMTPEIALPIMARAWVRGDAAKWSCWRDLYGN